VTLQHQYRLRPYDISFCYSYLLILLNAGLLTILAKRDYKVSSMSSCGSPVHHSKLVDFEKKLSPFVLQYNLSKKYCNTAINTTFKKYWQYGGNTQRSIANSVAILLVLQY